MERQYRVVHWADMPRGGHFAAMEQPELFVEDLRAFFRTLSRKEADRVESPETQLAAGERSIGPRHSDGTSGNRLPLDGIGVTVTTGEFVAGRAAGVA